MDEAKEDERNISETDDHDRAHPGRPPNSILSVESDTAVENHAVQFRNSNASRDTIHHQKRACYASDDCLRVYSIIPRIFSAIAFALSLVVLLDCRLILLQRKIVRTQSVFNTTTLLNDSTTVGVNAQFYFGLYQHASPIQIVFDENEVLEVDDLWNTSLNISLDRNFSILVNESQCASYPDDFPVSPQQVAARAFAVIAVILGGWMLIIVWFKCCCRFLCTYLCPDFLVSVTFLIFLPVAQGLSLIFDNQVCNFNPIGVNDFTTDTGWIVEQDMFSCGVNRRGVYYPASIILWILCGILFTFIKPRAEDDLPYFASGPVHYTSDERKLSTINVLSAWLQWCNLLKNIAK